MLALLLAAAVAAQPDTAAPARPDSAPVVVEFAAVARQVRANHPAVLQAAAAVAAARGEQRVARGGFDPQLVASWSAKRLGPTDYYDARAAKLRVPTLFGPDLEVGYERTVGEYALPDRRTPGRGLLTAAVTLPLGQRLLTDERRTAVAVAEAARGAAEGERDAAEIAALLAAARDYGRWYETTRQVAIAEEGVALATFRLAGTRDRVAAGDAAAVDTVEARLELQRRLAQRVEAGQAATLARLAVEAHLWDARGAPVALPPGAVPAPPDEPAPADPALVEGWVAALPRHPDVRRAEARVAEAAAGRRLAAQQRIPLASATYKSLARPAAAGPLLAEGFAADGRAVEASLSSSLLQRRERGRLDAAEAREERLELDATRARRELAVRLRQAAAELTATAELVALQRTTIAQARQLRDAEQRRLEGGESTLFVVNARDRAVLDEELRLAALEARGFVARAALLAAAGRVVE